jgi:hypothetical protein
MWKNIVERDRLQITRWRMHIPCWLTKATNTHSVYVILTLLHDNSCCTRTHLNITSHVRSLYCVYSLWADIGVLAVGLDGVLVT